MKCFFLLWLVSGLIASAESPKASPKPATAKASPAETKKEPSKEASPPSSQSKEEDTEVPLPTSKKYTDQDAIDIVTKAEQIRAVENAELEVTLKTIGGEKDTNYLMQVQRGEGKRALVDFLEPAEDYGRRLLVVKDRYWSKFPSSRKIHPISRREMLGNSVFGIIDLFQLDVHEEYKATIAGEVKLGDKECYKAVLDARHDNTVYKKIDYYIAKSDNYPVKAKFYAASGRLLKTLYLTGRRKMAGQIRPDAFTMVDNVTEGRKSYWKTVKMSLRKIPAHIFRRSYLNRKN